MKAHAELLVGSDQPMENNSHALKRPAGIECDS